MYIFVSNNADLEINITLTLDPDQKFEDAVFGRNYILKCTVKFQEEIPATVTDLECNYE